MTDPDAIRTIGRTSLSAQAGAQAVALLGPEHPDDERAVIGLATSERLGRWQHQAAQERLMTEINKDEHVAVARTEFNVANVIASIALLALVLGGLKYFGVF